MLQLTQSAKGNIAEVMLRDRMLRETESTTDERTNRCLGTFRQADTTKDDVLVEWKLADSSRIPPGHANTSFHDMAKSRFQSLASLLKESPKVPDIRILECLGVVMRDLTDDEIHYGLVSRAPSTRYKTLKDILSGPPDDMALDDWFAIAHSIARAVLCIHLSGWLHKGIRSENILYFLDNEGKISYNKPYIAGFEYSRQALKYTHTESVCDDMEANLYRHIEVQEVPSDSATANNKVSFSSKHEIFSVGVILLELGLQRSAIDIYKDAKRSGGCPERHSATAFSDWIVEKELPKLGRLRGKGYLETTKVCLKLDFGNSTQAVSSEVVDGELLQNEAEVIQKYFWRDVVRPISGGVGGLSE